MSLDRARSHLAAHGLADRIKVFDVSCATVALAADALGTDPAHIAKSLTFLVDGAPVLVVAAGDARVANPLFRAEFGVKATMIPAADVGRHIGHDVGGVCPFGVRDGVRVHLDESLRRFDVVYPACGSDDSVVRLTLAELEAASGALGWVRVCRVPDAGGVLP